MEGNSNSATLTDLRPAFPRAERGRHAPFLGPAHVHGLDYTWWEEQRELHTSHSPLSVAGFVRLGGFNPSSPTARKNGKHRGSFQQVDDVVPPPARGKSTFRRPESVAGESPDKGRPGWPQATAAASSTSTGAGTPYQLGTPGASPEADCNTESVAINEDSASEVNAAADAEPSPAAAEQCPFQQLRELSKRVQGGDESAIAGIRNILDGNEALWRQLGDIDTATEAMLIEFAAGSAAVKESVRRSVAALKQSLLGEQPTPLERMAVGRVVACWLLVHFLDRWCGWAIKQSGHTAGLAKLLEACEKRLQTALKSLKLVRMIES